MASKAQFQLQGLPLYRTAAIFQPSRISVTKMEQCETRVANLETPRTNDAARLFESAPDAMLLVDGQGRIAVVNALVEDMFGYRRDELLGEPITKLILRRKSCLAHSSQYATAQITSETGANLDLYGLRKDGSEFSIEISFRPFKTQEGLLIWNAIRDISHLKCVEELQLRLEFELSISRLSKTFINLPGERVARELKNGLKELAEVLDLDWVSINLFRSYEVTGGTTHAWTRPGITPVPDKIVSKEFSWVASRIATREMCFGSVPADLPEEAAAEREYLLSGGDQSLLIVPLQVGGELLGSMNTSSARQRKPHSTLLISSFQQAAEVFANALHRKRAAEAQQEGENRFRLVADTAPLMIWMSGTDKLPTFFNQGWLAFRGRTMEQESGEGWLCGVHPDDLNHCLQTYSDAFDARTEFTVQYRLRRADGEYRWLAAHAAPRLESNGTFHGYIGSCVDITDQKLSEEMVLQTSDRLVEAHQQITILSERREEQTVLPREEVKLEHHHHEVIGHSERIRRVLKKAEQVACTDSTVLLLGETGTGKELVARTIHEVSRRRQRAMVKVNCAALPASLVESELFGREKGAYTGALTREMGRFELANGSTILLDEIGELPLELQSKLLRVLQEGEFERLGSAKTIKVDVRVIAATSRNLQLAVREGKFREDLFYRLNVFPMTIPPLRERREDIPALVWHFVNELSQRMGRSIEAIQARTMEAFKNYSWPGNVRELRNVIERFLITNTSTVFQADFAGMETTPTGIHAETFEEVERNHILRIMGMVGWRVRGEGGAAQILGLKPTTLESRMQKLDITRPQ